jgi:hypothetical protein
MRADLLEAQASIDWPFSQFLNFDGRLEGWLKDSVRIEPGISPHSRTFANNWRTGAPAFLCAMTAYCRMGAQRLFPKFDLTVLMLST